MARPTKITPDPIIDAIVEFRFESNVPPDAILGMLFNVVRDDFPEFTKLPITELPEKIRAQDPALKFAPFYQSSSGPFRLNVGPNAISLGNPGKYVGWEENFAPFLAKLVKNLETSGIVKEFTRIGIRYIDFFKNDIFKNITLSINLNDTPLKSAQTTISTVFVEDIFISRVQILNNSVVNIGTKQDTGSVIDTDTYCEVNNYYPCDELMDIVNNQHRKSLDLFFRLLKPEFIETLDPKYDDD